jgi:uncharacterized protein YqjF (DUF2071 family)
MRPSQSTGIESISRLPPRTVRRPVFRQQWLDLTYLHWPYDPDVVARYLPDGVEPDVAEGSAWVGLIPFRMRGVSILGTPPLPYLSAFLETNVRTYGVDRAGRRVVVFLSLDADRLLPVVAARISYRLPYVWSRMSATSEGAIREYRCERRGLPGSSGSRPHSRIRIRIGERVDATPLDDFLSARWGLASRWYGRTVHAPVAHEPWRLYAAELLDFDDELLASHGLPVPDRPPRVLWSPGVSVRIGAPGTVPPST